MRPEQIETVWHAGDAAGAIALAEAAAASGGDRLEIAEALLRVAADLSPPEWEGAARLAVRLREVAWPADHPRAAYAAMPLADLLRRDGRPAEADAVLAQAEAAAAQAAESGESGPLRDVVFARAKLHLGQGNLAKAEQEFRRAADIEAAGRHPKRPPFTLPLAELAALYRQQQRDLEAAAVLEEQLAIGSARMGVHDEAILRADLGRSLLRAGRTREALAALERSRDLLVRLEPEARDPLLGVVRALIEEAAGQAPEGGGVK